jgi:hypothetical protein
MRYLENDFSFRFATPAFTELKGVMLQKIHQDLKVKIAGHFLLFSRLLHIKFPKRNW